MSSSIKSSKQSSRPVSKPGKTYRLNRYLADCGLGSRRKVESLVTDGKIVVNGKVCTDLAMQITEDQDIVQYSGKELKRKQDKIYIILNKPAGFVVSAQDEYSRKTVYDLLPEKYANLPYAGRLDKGSEGLLLFTNDGELIKQLTHPSHKVVKSYRVDIDKKLSHNDLIRLRNGVEIEGGVTQKAGVFVKKHDESGMTLKIEIHEGRKRQIRQMIQALGAKVVALRRLQFGPLVLKDLPVGRWRELTPAEIFALRRATDNQNRGKQ